MNYDNEMSNRSLGMYADKEYIDVSKELLNEVVRQIDENCINDDLDEHDAADHAVAGLMQLFVDVSADNGYHQLMYDLQELSVKYGLSFIKTLK